MTFKTNKAGVPLLDQKGKRIPLRPASKPTVPVIGRSIAQNLKITLGMVRKATSHDAVVSGGIQ